ncbi:MAG: 4Fe-4S dicluster domain-containing protein [Proteobacteria bacterium]|nr:4Fe-4S dicluster domain-containing protein [Pseudomonadota bacterium]
MSSKTDNKNDTFNKVIPRRNFLVVAGTFIVGVGIGSCTPSTAEGPLLKTLDVKFSRDGIPVSTGYILVDTKKCQGCMTCMLACSLVHEGKENPSLARIQIIQNPFGKFPDDLTVEQCRQCVDPACLKACSEEALTVDGEHGNVRRIDAEKCIGCQKCVDACPYNPSRAVWNFQEDTAQKCDLCADTPHWKRQGGPIGQQACLESCPLGAIVFSNKVPVQEGDEGYEVNLRGKGWENLGYSRS